MKKIIYIIPSAHHIGGIQSLAFSIRQYFQECQKMKVDTVNFEYTVPLLFSAVVKFSPEFLKKTFAKKLIFSHFEKKLQCKDTNLIHCWHLDAAMFLPKEHEFVVTVHGLEVLNHSIDNNWYRKTYYQETLDRAKQIVCDSEFTRELITKRFNVKTDKLSVIYPPIDVLKFVQKKKQTKEFTIGTLCRFVERKNVKNVVSALNILYKKLPNFTFLLAGDGPQRDEILALLKEAPFEWKYLGKISEEEKINDFYPNLDLFVMPTLAVKDDIEGFGIVYLEANASGVPVIGSRNGGASEAISENVTGLFTQPEDAHDIAQKMYQALSQQTFATKELVGWAKKFDLTVSGKKYLKVYSTFN